MKYFGNMSHFSVTNKVVWMSTIATIFFPFKKEFGWLCGKFKGIGNCIRPPFMTTSMLKRATQEGDNFLNI